ncbi:hypothetical protein [Pelagibacterium halotolerans]|uniref:hypothetical protein n=1 Tax=Pelagibacterium halotolerans TaxID=531813 RepID=UPI0005A0CCB2
MYRKLLATTALALVVTGGAYAQEMAPADPAMAPADPMMETPAEPEVPEEPLVSAEETGINADGWLATEIIGETIYNSTGDDAEAIGDVNDFVLVPKKLRLKTPWLPKKLRLKTPWPPKSPRPLTPMLPWTSTASTPLPLPISRPTS